jgi:hypothetical protein
MKLGEGDKFTIILKYDIKPGDIITNFNNFLKKLNRFFTVKRVKKIKNEKK